MPEGIIKNEGVKERPRASDINFYGRQVVLSLAIINIDSKTKRLISAESYRQAMDRIGAKTYADFVKLDSEGHYAGQKSIADLRKIYGERLLRPRRNKDGIREGTEKETFEELEKDFAENGMGINQGLGAWSAKQVREKALGLQGARTELDKVYAKIVDKDFYIREYKRDHDTILTLAKAPWETFKAIMDNDEIDRERKLQMWSFRCGDYAAAIADIQAKVDNHEIRQFGTEYKRLMLSPYQEQTKRLKHELIEMTKWNVPIPGYTKLGVRPDATVKVGRGGGGETLTFEDLRHTIALWQGSSSTAFAEGKGTFGDDEGRSLGGWKRKPVTDFRDAWAGIMIAFGEEGNESALPMVAGTTDYESVPRALKWAAAAKEEAEGIMASPTASVDEKREAEDMKNFAEMILDGPQKTLPEFFEPDGNGGVKLIKQEERDKKVRDARKDLKDLTANCAKMSPEDIDAAKRQRIQMIKKGGNLYYLVDRLIKIEGGYAENEHDPTGIAGWHEGKNDKSEVVGLLHRRDLVSPPIVYGLPVANLVALLESGHDPVEKKGLWESVLMLRERSFIDQCIVNDNIARIAGWPNSTRLKQIQHERDRHFLPKDQGGVEEPLPENPFANKGSE